MKQARPRYDLEFFYTSFPQRDLVRWYQWEFLRRNSDYAKDYGYFENAHGKWLGRKGYWYDLSRRPKWSKADERFFYTKIAPDVVRLCVKWRVVDLYPPHCRFPKINKGSTSRLPRNVKQYLRSFKTLKRHYPPNKPMSPPTGTAPELNWDFPLVEELFGMGFTGNGGSARRFGHLVLLEFDLKWPMKDQLDFAKRVLKRANDNYRFGLQQHGGRFPGGRRRFEDYDSHLKVWDLTNRGRTAAQIAKAVFPLDHSDSVLQKVRDHLSAARRLIESHYTEIR